MNMNIQRLLAKIVDSKDTKTVIGYKFYTKIGTRSLFQTVLKEQAYFFNYDFTNIRMIGKLSVIDGDMKEILTVNDKNQYISGQALSIVYKKDNQYLVLNGLTEQEKWVSLEELEKQSKEGEKYFNVTVNSEGVHPKKQPLLDLSRDTVRKNNALKKDFIITGKNKTICNGLKEGVHKKVLEIPQGIIYINPMAFAENKDIEEVRIPTSVRYIEVGAFQGCTNLKRVIIDVGCEVIGAFAFSKCSNLKEVVLPQGLYSLGKYSFSNTGIEEINIPNTVTTIEMSSFSSCENLKRVHLPKRLKKLNDGVFALCTSLKEIRIPKGVKEIEDNAFLGCFELKVVKPSKHCKEAKN